MENLANTCISITLPLHLWRCWMNVISSSITIRFFHSKKVTQLQPSCAQVHFNPFRDGARADKCCRIGTFPLELFVATWTWWLSVWWRHFSCALLIYLLRRTRMVVTTHKVRAERALFPWSRLVAVEYEAELNRIYSFSVFQADSWAVIGKSRTVLMSYRLVPRSDQGMFVGQFLFNVAKETLWRSWCWAGFVELVGTRDLE